jgi:hypothetical protein
MKTTFTPRFVCKAQLYQPNLLIRAINSIADNEEEYTEFRQLQPSERVTWLKTWLRKKFPAYCFCFLLHDLSILGGALVSLHYLGLV